MFRLLLLSMSLLLGLSIFGSWLVDRAPVETSPSAGARDARLGTQSTPIAASYAIRKSIKIIQGLSLIVCGILCGAAFRLREKARRNEVERQTAELALERRVEERSRELWQELEERRLVEHLHRGHRRIIEMLAGPGDLKSEDILRFLAEAVASRSQGWECAIHLMDRRGKTLQLTAHSDVSDRMKTYLEAVGTQFADSPECQASASGETHIVE